MSCSPIELKDYLFGELEPARRTQVADHLGQCRSCREELDRLRLTEAALHALVEEDPPRRIAFVSDKVFAPRWWQVWWQSGPRAAFAGAAMLALAIVAHAFIRPPSVLAPHTGTAAIEARVNAEVARRLETAIQAAVAQSEARQAKVVETVRQDLELQRRADRVAFEETITVLQKKYNNVLMLASSEPGGRP